MNPSGADGAPPQDRKAAFRSMLRREALEWAQSIAIALVLTLIIRTFIIQAFKIPSGSMIPTLEVGDKLFVSKYVYRFHPPERGDIVVFRFPGDKKKDFIKRVAAFGGETIEIRDEKIYVDGRELDDPRNFGRFRYFNHDPFAGPNEKVRVPEDHLYVLGDNSANSTDSRFWGFVPMKNVLGKAVFRWWPPSRIGRIE